MIAMALRKSVPQHSSGFVPHPLLRGGHRQTLAGLYLPSRWRPHFADVCLLTLKDGDGVVLHDNRPAAWQAGGPVGLLLHGLCGCHGSAYMERITAKLNQRGVRTFRMDQRGWGAGVELAQLPMHAGRSEDMEQAVRFVQSTCPDSPLVLVGFSLGANVLLKFLAESSQAVSGVRAGIAVSPPMDLIACAQNLRAGLSRWYERYFVAQLMKYVRQRAVTSPAWSEQLTAHPRVASLWDFDQCFTAPLSGFASAEDYYRQCSTVNRLHEIPIPVHILAAQDDPLVPSFAGRLPDRALPPHVQLCLPEHGGHLGFVGRTHAHQDGRWMDQQVVAWFQQALDSDSQ